MRAIDGDALKDRLQNLAYDDWNQGVSTTWANAYSECADIVEQMPTIEERKKGRWIQETKHYKDSEQEFYYYEERCSECGTKRKIGWAEARYCPMCGARMQGMEGEEHETTL